MPEHQIDPVRGTIGILVAVALLIAAAVLMKRLGIAQSPLGRAGTVTITVRAAGGQPSWAAAGFRGTVN